MELLIHGFQVESGRVGIDRSAHGGPGHRVGPDRRAQHHDPASARRAPAVCRCVRHDQEQLCGARQRQEADH